MAQELYSRLLNAEDPRIAIYEVRKRLFAHSNHYHDWAAVVAYASLPADFDLQTGRLQYEMTKRHIDRTLNMVDMLANLLVKPETDNNKQVEDLIDEIEVVLKQLDLFTRRLCDHAGQNSRSIGLQASTEKRKADAFYSVAEAIQQSLEHNFEKDKSDARIKTYRRKALGSLLTAHGLYLKAITYQIDDWVDIYWVGVNYLSTTLILKLNNEIRESVQYDHWVATKKACELDAIRVSSIPAWRHASLAELFLIAAIVKNDERLREAHDMSSWPLEKDQYMEYGLWHLDTLCQTVDLASFEFYSTWRQINRYIQWWQPELGESNSAIVKEFFHVLEKHRKADC